MTNILTATEASTVLRCAVDDPEMLALLPIVDKYIEMGTGRDWTADAQIYPQAKAAARMILVRWHEDPGGLVGGGSLTLGAAAALVQLEALGLQLASTGVPDEPLALLKTNISGEIAVTTNIVLVFNHEMAAAATSAVTLKETDTGISVAVTNSLDVTKKILTVNPDSNLSADTGYTLVIDHPADKYGQTIDTEISFWTED